MLRLRFQNRHNSESGQMSAVSDPVVIIILLAALAIKLCGLVLGYLVVRLGYAALEKGLKGDFELFGKISGGWGLTLRSVSPGLLFVLLGSLLAGFTLYLDRPLGVDLFASIKSESGDNQGGAQPNSTPARNDIFFGQPE